VSYWWVIDKIKKGHGLDKEKEMMKKNKRVPWSFS